MLDLKYICKSFNDVRVMNGVNLHSEMGLVHTLKGGNGSEKTSLNNILAQETKIFAYPTEEQEYGVKSYAYLRVVAQFASLLAPQRLARLHRELRSSLRELRTTHGFAKLRVCGGFAPPATSQSRASR